MNTPYVNDDDEDDDEDDDVSPLTSSEFRQGGEDVEDVIPVEASVRQVHFGHVWTKTD